VDTYVACYLTSLLMGCGYALARGGAPERWGAGVVIAGMALSNLAGLRSGHLFLSTDVTFLLVDVIEALALTILACTANRFWPLWAAMFQLDAVFTHAVMFAQTIPPSAYAFALKMFALPLPLLVGIGAWRYRIRNVAHV
jgi:hypothetical protein